MLPFFHFKIIVSCKSDTHYLIAKIKKEFVERVKIVFFLGRVMQQRLLTRRRTSLVVAVGVGLVVNTVNPPVTLFT